MTLPSRLTPRTVLTADAIVALAMGLLLMIVPGTLAGLTALPAGLVFYTGLALMPLGALMLLIGQFAHGNPRAVWLVILGNEAWVVASIVLLVSGWVAPNAFGIVFVIAQALVVALFAVLEYASLRTMPRLNAARA